MPAQKEMVIKLTSMRWKQPHVTDEAFHEHGSKYHGPRAAVVQKRHGALRVTQYYTTKKMRDIIPEKIPWALRPGFNIADWDATISVYVRTTEQMMAIVMDPDFQALVAGDNDYVDTERATVTAGWEEVYVDNGEIVNVVDGQSQYPPYSECIKLADASQPTPKKDIEF